MIDHFSTCIPSFIDPISCKRIKILMNIFTDICMEWERNKKVIFDKILKNPK